MWTQFSSCYYQKGDISHKSICAFDYDNTLCELMTSNPLPNVLQILYHISNYHNIIIFSNQKGVSLGKCTDLEVQRRFDEFSQKCSFNPTIIYSTKDDEYRKPMDGMWRLSLSFFGEDAMYEYYCGDAAGRKTDFSISDLYFANNCNIIFKTPEQIFQNGSDLIGTNIKKISPLYKDDMWYKGVLSNPREIVNTIKPIDVTLTPKTLVMMVGPQGSGKSTMTKHLSKSYKTGIINRDTQKTMNHMKKAFNKFSKERDIIVIDNTNNTFVNRNMWRDQLPDWNYVIIYFDISKTISFHMTKYRAYFTNKIISKIPIHSYYKHLEPPSESDCDVFIHLKEPVSDYTMNQNLRFV